MTAYPITAFRLPSGLPARSVAMLPTRDFAAVDGQENAVYTFSECGCFQCSYDTIRPYRALHCAAVGPAEGSYLALSSCACGRRVFLLNCRFEEIGSIDLLAEASVTCNCPFRTECGDLSELMDAFPTAEGDEARIHAAFRHSVRSFNYNGRQLATLQNASDDQLNLHYGISGSANALHFRYRNTEFVRIIDGAASFLGALPESMVLRGFAESGVRDFYGVFGYRYLYNYLLPIYQNGQLVLPATDDMKLILQNLCPCP